MTPEDFAEVGYGTTFLQVPLEKRVFSGLV